MRVETSGRFKNFVKNDMLQNKSSRNFSSFIKDSYDYFKDMNGLVQDKMDYIKYNYDDLNIPTASRNLKNLSRFFLSLDENSNQGHPNLPSKKSLYGKFEGSSPSNSLGSNNDQNSFGNKKKPMRSLTNQSRKINKSIISAKSIMTTNNIDVTKKNVSEKMKC